LKARRTQTNPANDTLDIYIADPNDAGMLDIVGFDSAAPNLIAAFAREAVC
jgi:hypothetical protein